MTELFDGVLFAGALLALSVVLFFVAISRKSRNLIYLSLLAFLLMLGAAGWTAYRFVSKSYHKVAETIRPRTGAEIYAALFGPSPHPCLKVLHHQDQLIPKVDYAIRLHVATCSEEVDRILAQHPYEVSRLPKERGLKSSQLPNADWFRPDLLGDTVAVYHYDQDDYGNGQTVYTNTERTEAIIVDILD